MAYDLMLLADPGTEREKVLQVLEALPELSRDPQLTDRFWLTLPRGKAQFNIGTKDPVESIHMEMDLGDTELMEAATRWTLTLAEQIDMRVEDVQWGHEVHLSSLPALREYWTELQRRLAPAAAGSGSPAARRPWWRPW